MLEFSFCGVKWMCLCGGGVGRRGAVLPQGRCSFHLFGTAIEKKASTVYVVLSASKQPSVSSS